MISYMTKSEEQKVHEITERLRRITSPVLRLQAILQFSQIVDILTLGDTNEDEHIRLNEIIRENDRLNEELNSIKGNEE